jgi:hypothetical protein
MTTTNTTTPCYIESRVYGQWTREGLCAPREGGHYAYPSREAAEAMLPDLRRDLAVVSDDGAEPEMRIVDAEPGAIVE